MNLPDAFFFPDRGQATPERLSFGALTVILRHAQVADIAVFRTIYADTRATEPLLANMTSSAREAFVDQQFELQHRYFTGAFPLASCFAVALERGGMLPLGYLYIDCSEKDWHLIDILLAPQWRGLGIGSGILAWLQRKLIAGDGERLTLNVAATNQRAIALYTRLGFEETGAGPIYRAMAWCPAA